MNTPPPDTTSSNALDAVIAAYLEAVEAGQAPDRAVLLARHPGLADELRAFFVNHDRLARLGAPLRGTAPPGDGAGPVRLRYFGDYELLGEIARGGMGVVYRARQVSLNRIVALKMILAGRLATPAEVHRFRTEAENAANLDHPHIVPLYEVGECAGQHYFSMKLVEGSSLVHHLPRFRQDHRAAAQLLAAVARAVHHAHERGILHRDIKPANILLDAAGEPHVTDFGLAKRVGSRPSPLGDAHPTQSGAIVGTPSYMAPEQARAEKVLTTAVDVYSLGAVLYELLTGQPPFRTESPLDTVLHLLAQEPPRPRDLNPRVDRDLETICLKCLAKDPRQRYASAEALAADLDRFREGKPILARPLSGWARGVKWARRRPAVAALLACLIVVTLAGVCLVTWQWQEALRSRREAEAHYWQALKAQERAESQEHLTREQLRLRESALYANHIALAQREWQDNNLRKARQVLGDCLREHRHWEWYYLNHLFHSRLLTLRGHKDGVTSLAWSPDGQRIASTSRDGTVKVWDAATGREKLTIKDRAPRKGWVATRPGEWTFTGEMLPFSITFSPDGKRLVAARMNDMKPDTPGGVQVWDAATGREVLTLAGFTHWVTYVTLSRDGKYIAAATRCIDGDETRGEVRVYNAVTGRQTVTVRTIGSEIRGLAFSPDGQHLAVPDWPGRVKLWDAVTGKEKAVFKVTSERSGIPSGVAFSPDGKWLAAACEGEVRVWNLSQKDPVGRRFPSRGDAGRVVLVFSPDSNQLAGTAGLPEEVKVWDVATGKEVFSVKATHPLYSVAFSPDGKRIAAGGYDKVIEVWDVTHPPEARVLGADTNRIDCVAFSPNGKHLASTSWGVRNGTVIIRDATTGKDIRIFKGHADASPSWVAFSPDSRRVASGDHEGQIRLWDPATGREDWTVRAHAGSVRCVVFSPDGRHVASAGDEGVKVWDAATGREALSLRGGRRGSRSVAFSPDGKRLAAGGQDTVRVWDTASGKEVMALKGHNSPVWTVAFSPDGRLLASGSMDGTVRLWESSSGRERFLLKGYVGNVLSVAFSPDGKRLAVAADNVVKVWNTRNGQEAITLRGHAGHVTCVAFSPDGKQLATCNDTHTDRLKAEVRIWDTTPLKR
jgi:WD40 repeat protein